jgi:hypothetical protein
MTRLWIYEGSLNEARNELTLETEGPSFAEDGTLVPYQDVIEIESDDHWTLKSRAPQRRRRMVRVHDRTLPPQEIA